MDSEKTGVAKRMAITMSKFSKILSLSGKTAMDSFWIQVAKLAFLPKRIFSHKTNMGKFLLRDSVAKTGYGFFFCRKQSDDLGIISESFEQECLGIFKPEEGDLVIDCGAHIGKYSILASKLVGGKGRVISIEALPENFTVLKKNISLNNCKNVILLNSAMWKNRKKLKLYTTDFANTASSLKAGGIPGKLKFLEVEGITLDSLIPRFNGKTIKWMKMDVEGAEVEAFMGAKKIINTGMISNIILESTDKNMKRIMAMLGKDYSMTKLLGNNYFVRRNG